MNYVFPLKTKKTKSNYLTNNHLKLQTKTRKFRNISNYKYFNVPFRLLNTLTYTT